MARRRAAAAVVRGELIVMTAAAPHSRRRLAACIGSLTVDPRGPVAGVGSAVTRVVRRL